jgi:hypothetical protein
MTLNERKEAVVSEKSAALAPKAERAFIRATLM